MFGKKNWFVVALLAVVLTACTSNKKEEVAVESNPWGDSANAWGSGYSIDQLRALGIDKNPLEYTTVYFEYNSSQIDERSTIIVSAHAKNLAAKSGTNVVLEGHTDERGTREYNLSLGERRSTAVQTLMQTVGAGSNSLSAVSYGEERPVALTNDDAAWKANRRVQILY